MRWGGLAGKIEGNMGGGGSSPDRPRIVIIGAGIAGLAAAYRLTRPDFCPYLDPEVLLLERSSRAGGSISTYELEDYTLELGPDMFQTAKPEALDLCNELGLSEHIVPTNEAFRRTFVAFGGQLHALPEGFQMLAPSQLGPFFSSSLLSLSGKLRMAMDLLIPKKSDHGDESLAAFVRRRFGQEALDRIAQPMAGGLYTADPEVLSLQATLPRFLDMEQKYGSVIRGLMQDKKQNGSSGTVTGGADGAVAGCRYNMFASLDRGLGMLVERLVGSVPPDTLHFQCPIVAIEKGTRGKAYDIFVANGTVVPCDAVIVTTPAYAAGDMLTQLSKEASSELKSIKYASSAVMNLIYNRADIPHALDGFGFVVPAIEKRAILACSFASVKFPGRCPPEKAVLRVFVGGALQQDVFEYTDEQIECLMWEDLNTYLGLKSVPLLSLITRYQRAMPQYNIGHVDLVNGIREKLNQYPGIAIAGSAYEGVGIPDCISSGYKAARSIVQLLEARVAANAADTQGSAAASQKSLEAAGNPDTNPVATANSANGSNGSGASHATTTLYMNEAKAAKASEPDTREKSSAETSTENISDGEADASANVINEPGIAKNIKDGITEGIKTDSDSTSAGSTSGSSNVNDGV